MSKWNPEDLINLGFDAVLVECMSAYADENNLDKAIGCNNCSFGFATSPRTLKKDFAEYFGFNPELISKQVEFKAPALKFYDEGNKSTCTRYLLYKEDSEEFFLVDCDTVDGQFTAVWAAKFTDEQVSYILKNLEELKTKYITNKEEFVASQNVRLSKTF